MTPLRRDSGAERPRVRTRSVRAIRQVGSGHALLRRECLVVCVDRHDIAPTLRWISNPNEMLPHILAVVGEPERIVSNHVTVISHSQCRLQLML